MIDMVPLAPERSNGLLADVFEDEKPQTLVLQRVQDTRTADGRGFGCGPMTRQMLVEGRDARGRGDRDRGKVDWEGHDGCDRKKKMREKQWQLI